MTFNNTGIRSIVAIVVLGLAGYFGMTAGTHRRPGINTDSQAAIGGSIWAIIADDTDGPQPEEGGRGCRGYRGGERR